MKNKEILKKAIEKIVKNGYKPKGLTKAIKLKLGNVFYLCDNPKWLTVEFIYWGETFKNKPDNQRHWYSFEQITFSHDFAKAFWEEKQWQYHLQQMVLETDSIKYLEKFL